MSSGSFLVASLGFSMYSMSSAERGHLTCGLEAANPPAAVTSSLLMTVLPVGGPLPSPAAWQSAPLRPQNSTLASQVACWFSSYSLAQPWYLEQTSGLGYIGLEELVAAAPHVMLKCPSRFEFSIS